MQSSKRQRNRGFLLTDIGRLKLEAARQAAEKLDNQGERYTVEQLSQRTGLDLSTITRVLNISTRVDRRTLERFFQGFNLELKPEDFFKPKVESNFKHAQDSVDYSVPIYYPVTGSGVYGRERELEQLKNYLLKPQSQRDRTIILYGIGGVGKTAVAVKLIDEVKDDFECVYWRSLSTASSLPQVLSAILQHFSLNIAHQGFETQIAQLISFMQQRRCLLVFDNVENIFDSGSASKSEYSYEAFFNYLCTTIHRSCIILISCERLNTITLRQSQSLLIESLNIEAGKKLISDRGIVANVDIIEELIKNYEAHPLSLNLAATTILDIFNGDVKEFLADKITVFKEIEKLLEKQLARLSEGEISVLYWLAVNGEPNSLVQLREDTGLAVSSNQIVGWLRELQKRILIEKVNDRFTLQPLLRKYIINRLVQQTCLEIEGEQVKLLTTNALMKATAPDFIRQQQIEFILKPIIERLLVRKGRDRLLSLFSSLLNRQRFHTPRKPGYLAGNIFNLLRHLETDLHNWDFSSLSVWQADGRGINLQQCNFAFADLAQSKFTEDFGETLSLAVSPDGEQLAACDTNGQIRLWRLKDKRQQLTLRGHSAWTQAIAFSPDGKTLASCSSDREVRLWDINMERCLNILKSHQGRVKAIVFTSDGETLASGGDYGQIELWDLSTTPVKVSVCTDLAVEEDER